MDVPTLIGELRYLRTLARAAGQLHETVTPEVRAMFCHRQEVHEELARLVPVMASCSVETLLALDAVLTEAVTRLDDAAGPGILRAVASEHPPVEAEPARLPPPS